MFNPKLLTMKTAMKSLLLIPFFALLLFTSCQDEVTEITSPEDSEALTAESELTSLMFSTSIMDGSADNIIDKASCTSVKLPVTVEIKGLQIIIDSKEDFKVIEAIFNEFEDDDDKLEIIFPITIILSDHEEIVIKNREALEALIEKCQGDNVDDDDIECVDFQYPISFSVFNTEFQIINVVTIENDRQLYLFLKRVKNAEVIASLNFPITLEYADGTTIEVNNNEELARSIKEARNACDEDDDNDYGDDDFTKERLDELLMACPWDMYQFLREGEDITIEYKNYKMVFKEDGVLYILTPYNKIHETGKWSTKFTDNGVLLTTYFNSNAGFDFEWAVYELEPGKIKLFKSTSKKLILKKNCDVVTNITKERVKNFLKECLWRVDSLGINGVDKRKDYIGTPLKFLDNDVVKIRVDGDYLEGKYEIGLRNDNVTLIISLENRPNLKLEWLITFLEEDLIKLTNENSQMVLMRHCPNSDDDLSYVDKVLISGAWEVAKYDDGLVHVQDPTVNFYKYTLNFLESGRIKVTDPNNGITSGSWLAYRNDGLFLGMYFGNNAPFGELNHRWKIKEITEKRIELKDYDANGEVERILVLERI